MLTLHVRGTFKLPEPNQPGRRGVLTFHAALRKPCIPVAKEKSRRSKLGDTTKEAIKEFQRSTNLQVDGIIGPETIAGIPLQIAHAFFALSRRGPRTKNEKLRQLGYVIDTERVRRRLYGARGRSMSLKRSVAYLPTGECALSYSTR